MVATKDTAGVTINRDLTVMGYIPFESHCEMTFDNVRVPVDNLLGDVGAGFAMSQAGCPRRAIQTYGGGGLGQDFPLARMWVETRIIRLAEGPDEVHRRAVARTELIRFEAGMDPKPSGLLAHPATLTRTYPSER